VRRPDLVTADEFESAVQSKGDGASVAPTTA
jgi:hypothetical protein